MRAQSLGEESDRLLGGLSARPRTAQNSTLSREPLLRGTWLAEWLLRHIGTCKSHLDIVYSISHGSYGTSHPVLLGTLLALEAQGP